MVSDTTPLPKEKAVSLTASCKTVSVSTWKPPCRRSEIVPGETLKLRFHAAMVGSGVPVRWEAMQFIPATSARKIVGVDLHANQPVVT